MTAAVEEENVSLTSAFVPTPDVPQSPVATLTKLKRVLSLRVKPVVKFPFKERILVVPFGTIRPGESRVNDRVADVLSVLPDGLFTFEPVFNAFVPSHNWSAW